MRKSFRESLIARYTPDGEHYSHSPSLDSRSAIYATASPSSNHPAQSPDHPNYYTVGNNWLQPYLHTTPEEQQAFDNKSIRWRLQYIIKSAIATNTPVCNRYPV